MKTFLPYECTVGLLYDIAEESGMGDYPICFSMGGRGYKAVLSVEADDMGEGVYFSLSDEDVYDCQAYALTLNDVLDQCDELGLSEDALVIGSASLDGYMVTTGAWDVEDDLLVMKATKAFEG